MIRGVVTEFRPTVSVALRLPGQPTLAIEFVVDTGFQGALTLPIAAVHALGLPFFMEIQTLPASGQPYYANLHSATILWNGQETMVTVLATGTRPLLGTTLLRGYDLFVAFEEGGEVLITPRG